MPPVSTATTNIPHSPYLPAHRERLLQIRERLKLHVAKTLELVGFAVAHEFDAKQSQAVKELLHILFRRVKSKVTDVGA